MSKVRAVLLNVIKSEGIRQSIMMIVGNSAATGVSAVAIILASRLLGPIGFGEFSIGFSLLLILIRLNDVGLNAAIQKYVPSASSIEEKNGIMSYTVVVKIWLTLTTLVVGLLLCPWLANILHLPSPAVLYIAVIGSFVVAAYEHLVAFLQGLHMFSHSIVMNAIQAATKFIGIGAFWLLQAKSTLGVFALYTVAPFTAVIYGLFSLPHWMRVRLKGSFTRERLLLQSMIGHSAVGYIAAGVIENVDVFFVQHSLTAHDTGLYAGLNRISLVPLLVAYSLANVLNPRVAKYVHRHDLLRYIKKSWLVVLVSFLGVIVTIPFARFLILATIGGEYVSGDSLLVLLLAASFLTIAIIPFQALFFSFKANWYFSVSGVIQLLIVIVGNAYFVPRYGIAAAVWTRLISRIFLFCFSAGLGMAWFYRHYVREAK